MTRAEMTRTRSTTRLLTRTQLRELEADLRAERGRLERSLGAVADGVALADANPPPVPGDAHDGLAITLQSRVHARYQMVLDALQRIEEGAYGRCVGCDMPIPYGRLVVMPESAHCVGCGPRV